MLWGIIWAIAIGALASYKIGGSYGAAFIAFVVIWYFASENKAKSKRLSELVAQAEVENPDVTELRSTVSIDSKIEDLENKVEELKSAILSDDLKVGKTEFAFFLRKTGDDYINLKSRFIQSRWKLALARDWYKYAQILSELSSIKDWIGVADDKYESLLEESLILEKKRARIERAFQWAYTRKFIDRLQEWIQENPA